MRIAPGPRQGFNDASAILPTISVALISIIDAHHNQNRLKPFFFSPDLFRILLLLLVDTDFQ